MGISVPVFIILLSGDEPELAKAELTGAAEGDGARITERTGRVALLDRDIFDRMGYARMHAEHIASGDMETVLSELSSAELPEGSYAVRTVRYGNFQGKGMDVERSAGAIISERRPIDLKHPDNIIHIFLGDRIYAGITLPDNRGIPEREPTKRPFFSPVTLSPRMARALINLTGIRRGQRILDPFCGTGAILMEASLMGLHPIGSDRDPAMIEGARRNVEHYGAHAELFEMDIDGIRGMGADAISTDPPYGKSSTTNREGVELLYRRSFSAMADTIGRGKKLSIILPDPRYSELAEDFSILSHIPVRVHRSLTRHFFVMKRL